MFDYYFTFRSMTAAQLAVTELNKSGISSSLLRAPKAISSMGCSYAVRVSYHNGPAAALILRQTGIAFTKVFHLDDSAIWKEAFL